MINQLFVCLQNTLTDPIWKPARTSPWPRWLTETCCVRFTEDKVPNNTAHKNTNETLLYRRLFYQRCWIFHLSLIVRERHAGLVSGWTSETGLCALTLVPGLGSFQALSTSTITPVNHHVSAERSFLFGFPVMAVSTWTDQCYGNQNILFKNRFSTVVVVTVGVCTSVW